MEEVIVWVSAEGWLPEDPFRRRGRKVDGSVLSGRRHEAAVGTLDPAYRDSLAQVPGWQDSRRNAEDEARRHHRLDQLAAYRREGN